MSIDDRTAPKKKKKKKRKKSDTEAAFERIQAASRKMPPVPKTEQADHTVVWRILGVVGMTLGVAAAALAYPVFHKGYDWLDAEWRHWWVLPFLVLVPLIGWWGTFGQDRRRPRLRIGSVAPLRRGPRGWRTKLRDLPGVLRTVAVALFLVCLARPISVLSNQTTDEQGIDIVVVMDLSYSMRAVLEADPSDLPRRVEVPKGRRLTRLDTAKIVVQDFISRRETDRIGVVVFARSAFILSPPTLDYQLLSQLVSKMSLQVIDGNGTAIGDALGTSVARLRRSDALSKVIILLTDGDNNAGAVSPDYAVELANTVGCKVYTIQIGTGEQVEVQDGVDLWGRPKYKRQSFPVNPALLKRIAEKTGGDAFIATDAKALAQSMHKILDQLEKTRFESTAASHEELFAWLLLPGVFLIGLDALLRAWLLRRFP